MSNCSYLKYRMLVCLNNESDEYFSLVKEAEEKCGVDYILMEPSAWKSLKLHKLLYSKKLKSELNWSEWLAFKLKYEPPVTEIMMASALIYVAKHVK